MNARPAGEAPRAYRSHYRSARFVARLMSGLGWLLLCVVLSAALIAFKDSGKPMTLLAGAGLALGCLLLVALGQLIRATLDSADHSRQIRDLLSEHAFLAPSLLIRPRTLDDLDRRTAASAGVPAPTSASAVTFPSEMISTVASPSAAQCINPLCARLLPEADAVCPHCDTVQALGRRQSVSSR